MNIRKDVELLTGPAFSSHDPSGFVKYVKSLCTRAIKAAKPSSKVPACSMSKNKKGVWSIRLKRDLKFLTPDEIERLSEFYGIALEELKALIRKRKIMIGDPTQNFELQQTVLPWHKQV